MFMSIIHLIAEDNKMELDRKEIKTVPALSTDVEEESDLDIPSGFECPITQEIMLHPMIVADGHSYEKSAIEEWFRQGKHLSPLTGEKLPHRSLIPNVNLKKAIAEFLKKRPVLKRKEQELADLQLAIQIKEKELSERMEKLKLQKTTLDEKPVISKQEQHAKLLRAAKQGDLDEVNRLLAAGVDVDIEIKQHGYTPLFAATLAPDSRVFGRLMEAKGD